MNPKRIYKEEEGRELLMQGIRGFSYAVKSTLGPSGRTVIVDHSGHGGIIGGFKATKDGVTVARAIRFEDPVMDKAALMMVQAATKTALEAGDGTTTSVVLAEAILNEYERVSKETKLSPIEVTRDIQKICDQIVANLDKQAIPAEGEMLRQVATISANNDQKLGDQIYELFSKTDVVLVEKHSKETVETEFVEGIKLDVGWARPTFINNVANLSCELENPYVLICDSEIKSLDGLRELLEGIMLRGESILIVANFSERAMQTIAANVEKNGFKCLVVPPPAFGIARNRQISDLAYTLNARHFSDDTGDDYQLIQLSDLGKSVKVTATQDRTVIRLTPESVERSKMRVAELELAKKNTDEGKMDLDKRIKILKGNCGIIYVGAPTQIEAEELKDRIDDAVCAVSAAKEEGIVSGGGVALIDAFPSVSSDGIARKIMRKAILTPYNQILENAGLIDGKRSFWSKLASFFGLQKNRIQPNRKGVGINARTGEVVNMIDSGIIDPAKVTKNAIKNATSVATTIINTSAIVSNIIK